MMLRRLGIVIVLTFSFSASGVKGQEPNQEKKPPTEHKADSSKIATEMITLSKGESKFKCYLARPTGDKPAPGILLIHEWWGLNDWVKRQADRYAEQGYVALAVDLYRGEVATDAEHAHELMRGLADERALADLKQAFDYLGGSKYTKGKKVGVMGWCMGGGFALQLAIAEPKVTCTVMCYGKPVLDVKKLHNIKGPLLGIWGENDRGIDVAPFKKALEDAGIKAMHHIYHDVGHAFLNDTNKSGYNPAQAEKAWQEIDAFLKRSLEP